MNRTTQILAISLLAVTVVLGGGCTAKAKAARHVKRGHAFFENKEYEKAKFEFLNAIRSGNDDPKVLSQLGLTFFELGEAAPAYAALSRAKQQDPENIAVRSSLGSLFLALGDPAKAREEAEFILSKQPVQQEALLLLAGTSTNQQQLIATRERLAALQKEHPTNAFVLLALGHTQLRSGEITNAQASFSRSVQLVPTSPKIHSALAAVYLVQGMTNQAEAAFKSAAEFSPVKSGERLRWAEYKLRTGQAAEGRKILEEAVEKEPRFPAALNVLAEIALNERRTNDCEALVGRVLADDPNNYAGLLIRSRLHLLKRDAPSCLKDLETVEKMAPNDATIQYRKALAHLATSDLNPALVALDRAVTLNTNYLDAIMLRSEVQINKGEFASAIPQLTRVTRALTNFARAHLLLATAHRLRGNMNEALGVYDHLTKIAPKDPQAPYLMGVIYRQQNRTNEARAAYEKSLEIAPTFVPPIDDLIDLDIMANDFAAASRRIEKYVQDYPDKPAPYWFRAKIMAAQNKVPEAEAALQKALEVDPDYQPAQQSLARLYMSSGKPAEAIAKLEAVVQKNPKDFRSVFQIATLHEAMKDREKAVAAYNRCLEINRQYGPALNNLAYLLSEQDGDLERAHQLAREARGAMPNDPFTADTYGWILYKRGEYDKALPLIQESADKLRQPEVVFHLAKVFYRMGRENDARQAFTALSRTNIAQNIRTEAQASLAILTMDPATAPADALKQLNEALARDKSDLFACLRIAQIHAARKNNSGAKEFYEKALGINGKASSVLAAYAEFNLDQLNDTARAISLTRESWSASQSAADALRLGRVAYLAGEPKFALTLLQEAERATPSDPRVEYYSALAQFAVARAPQAFESARRAAAAQQTFPEGAKAKPLPALLDFYISQKDPNVAAQASKALLDLDGKSAPALLVSGMLHEQRKDYATARTAYDQALAAYPNFLPAQKQLALLLADHLVDDNRAQQLASVLRVELSGDPAVSRVLGKIAYRRGDYREAARLLGDLASRGTADADLLYHLGMAQFHNKESRAKQTLDRALALDPSAKIAEEAKKAVAQLK